MVAESGTLRRREDVLQTRVRGERLRGPDGKTTPSRLAVLHNGLDDELEHFVCARDVDAMHVVAEVIDAAPGHSSGIAEE